MVAKRSKARKAGKIAGGQVVNTTLSLKLVNAKTNKVLKTFTGSKKSTRGDVKSAASTSVYQLCKKKVSKIAKKIDASFSK